jgi:hypothetical protein
LFVLAALQSVEVELNTARVPCCSICHHNIIIYKKYHSIALTNKGL